MVNKEITCVVSDPDEICECDPNTTKVKRTRLPTSIFVSIPKCIEKLSKLEHIDLNGVFIQRIDNLSYLKNLKTLELESNGIRTITGLENSTNLEKLNLSHNGIQEVSGLDNLENLKELDISFNKINKIVGLKNLKNLRLLNLRDNKIGTISLEELHLENNLLKKLENLNHLNNLKHLELWNNSIRDIKRENLEGLDSLKLLFLGNNKLARMKDLSVFEALPSLEKLGMSSNGLLSLEGLGGMKKLKLLNANSNLITEMGKLPKSLEWIYLRKNTMEEINKSIIDLENLEVLDISDNKIKDITPLYDLKGIKKFKYLIAGNNNFDDFSTFEKFDKLTHLYVYGNLFDKVKMSSIKKMTSLKVLDLNDDESSDPDYEGSDVNIIPPPFIKNGEYNSVYKNFGFFSHQWFDEMRQNSIL